MKTTNITRINPFLSPDMLENLAEPTEAEVMSLRRQNPEHADKVFGKVAYDNGIEPDAALRGAA